MERWPENAIILIQHGSVPADRQTTSCLKYCLQRGYHLEAIGGYAHGDQVLRMAEQGRVTVAVVAYGGVTLAAELESTRARVEAVHPQPHVVRPRSLLATAAELIKRLAGKGKTPKQIAALLEESTADVTDVLRRVHRKR